jgi:hypothetical protein
MYGITRCDYDKARGWWVRLWQGVPAGKVTKQKFFGDAAYGKANGLKLAKAFRDKHMPEPPRYIIHFKARKDKLENLPVGVMYTKYIKKHRTNGRVYGYPYEGIIGAYSDDDSVQHKKYFNLATHSWDEAVRKALRFRRQGLAARK